MFRARTDALDRHADPHDLRTGVRGAKSVDVTAAASPQIVGSALAGNVCVSCSDTNGMLTNVVDYTIVRTPDRRIAPATRR
jgi:hypothetical protein